jgi:hypothetical protein
VIRPGIGPVRLLVQKLSRDGSYILKVKTLPRAQLHSNGNVRSFPPRPDPLVIISGVTGLWQSDRETESSLSPSGGAGDRWRSRGSAGA